MLRIGTICRDPPTRDSRCRGVGGGVFASSVRGYIGIGEGGGSLRGDMVLNYVRVSLSMDTLRQCNEDAAPPCETPPNRTKTT